MAVVVLTESYSIDSETVKINCFISYLKTQKMLDEGAPEYDRSNCDCTIVLNRERLLNKKIWDDYWVHMSEGEWKKCEPKLDQEKYSDLLFMAAVYNSSLQFYDKEKKVIEYTTEAEILFENAYKECEPISIGDDFDQRYTMRMSKDFNSINEYCARKFIVENGYLNSSHKVVFNPENLNVASINCAKVMKEVFEADDKFMSDHAKEDYKDSTEEQVACFLKKVKEQNPFSLNWKIAMLAEIGISDAERNQHRNEYIEIIQAHRRENEKCFEKATLD